MHELPTDPPRDEDTLADIEAAREATFLAEQAEAEALAEAQAELETEHEDADQEPAAVFTNKETGEEKEWTDLTVDEKLDALFGAVSELVARTHNAEVNITLVGQSLVRILQKAGEVSEGSLVEQPRVVVPRMDIPRDAGRRRS